MASSRAGRSRRAAAPAAAARGDAATSASRQADVSDGAKIIKTADLTVSVEKGKFTSAFSEASRIATANGGFVVSSSTSTTGFPGNPIPLDDTSAQSGSDSRARAGQLTIRVPAEKFDATRAALSGLGEVDTETINGQDVSSQLVDLGARITSLKAEEAAFQTLLGKATEIGDILQIQDQLFNVRTQIEQLEAEQANLNDQSTFSTITVSMYEPGVAFARTRSRADDPVEGVGRRDRRRAQRPRRDGRDPRLRGAARRPRARRMGRVEPHRSVAAPSSLSRGTPRGGVVATRAWPEPRRRGPAP